MLIVCPSCASGYSIDDDKIGPTGRTVRCASCRTDFFVTLADDRTAELQASALAQKLRAEMAEGARPEAADAAPEPHATPQPDALDAAATPEAEPVPDGSATADPEPGTADEGETGEGDVGQAEEAPAGEEAPVAREPQSHPPVPVTGWRRFIPGFSRRGAKGQKTKAKPARRGQPVPGRAASKAKASAKGGKHGKGLVRRLAGPAGLGLTGLAVIAGLVMQREVVVRHLPSSAPLYAALGMKVNIKGLIFEDIASTALREGEARFLVVEGMVRNVRDEAAPVPLIEVSVRGEDGRTLYSWTAEPPRATLRAGEALHFRTRLATPPEAGRAVAVRFADEARSASASR
jgi:predicted Zn finger-like uncharacterized protein